MPPTIHAVLLLSSSLFFGCAASPQERTSSTPQAPQHEIIALVDGQALTQDALERALYELAGDEVLTEYVLDRALAQQCQQQGVVIAQPQLEQERVLLSETLAESSQPDARVLDALRQRRGLGPDRFERLLRRNAMLRALTTADSEPDQRSIDRAIAQAFGPRYRVRLCTSDDPQPLGVLSNRVNAASQNTRSVEFANACFSISTHPSRDRGGLIESLSPTASGYPSALLSAVKQTDLGACSPVISTEAGYAIVLVEASEDARAPTPEQRQRVIDQLRRDTQRLAMQRLAQQLLSEHEVIVLDRSLNWAWSNRP